MKKLLLGLMLVVMMIGNVFAMQGGWYDPDRDLGNVPKDVNPLTDNAYDLGSSAKSWKDAYIDGTLTANTLDFGVVKLLDKSTMKEVVYRATDDTDAARGTALAAAFAASAAGDSIIIGPGDYSITAALAILDNQRIVLNSSLIYNTTNTSDIFTAVSKSNWEICGNGRLAGQGIGSGGLSTDQAGIYVTGSGNHYSIRDIYMYNFKAGGIIIAATISVGSYDGAKISNVRVTNSTYGLFIANGAEYIMVSNSIFDTCTTGAYVAAGNFNAVNSNFDGCGTGVRVNSGTNNGHGSFIGCTFNHCTSYGIHIYQIDRGMDFIGCEIFSAILFDTCSGVRFTGGVMGIGAIYATGTFTGYNSFQHFNFMSTPEPLISINSIIRPWFIFEDCYWDYDMLPMEENSPMTKTYLQGTGAIANGTTNVKTSYIDETPAGEWTGTDADIAASTDTSYYKEGTASLKVTIATGASAGDTVTNPLGGGDENWTGNEHVGFWIRTDVALAAGDLAFRITDSVAGNTDVNLPAILAYTWTWVDLDISAVADASKDVITDIAIVYKVDVGARNLYFDFMAKWDTSDETALTKNIVKDGMMSVYANPLAAGTAMAWVAKTEYTNYFIVYGSAATDKIVPMDDESANCFIMQYYYQ